MMHACMHILCGKETCSTRGTKRKTSLTAYDDLLHVENIKCVCVHNRQTIIRSDHKITNMFRLEKRL